MWDLQEIPSRWLLVGHTGTPQYPDEDAVALCADIDGLFVDLPPRPQERLTLLGCEPDGTLASALDSMDSEDTSPERAWLGNQWVSARPDDPAARRGWSGAHLLDVSESSFTHAFACAAGVSPGRYRRRVPGP
jgi:hypothetical protein